jgi:hypothetical protein
VGDAFRHAERSGTGVAFPSMMQPQEVGALVLKAIIGEEVP